MTTTIEISDPLLREARKLAERQGSRCVRWRSEGFVAS